MTNDDRNASMSIVRSAITLSHIPMHIFSTPVHYFLFVDPRQEFTDLSRLPLDKWIGNHWISYM